MISHRLPIPARRPFHIPADAKHEHRVPLLSSLCLIAVGASILVIVRQLLAASCRRASPLLRAYRPNRADNPIAFPFFLALYSAAAWRSSVVRGFLRFRRASPIPLAERK